MASIYKRKNKKGKTLSWKAVVRIKGYPSVCKSFERKEEADDWAQGTERDIKRGRFKFDQHNKLYTFEELIERFINDGKLEHHKSSKDTLRHLNFWKKKFGSYALVHLTTDKIGKERQLLINTPTTKGTKRSPATVNRYMSSLSAILTYAKKLKWIDENPCFAFSKLKESDGRDRVLSTDEIQRLLSACKESANQYLYCIVLISITTGARKGEILALKWPDIDFENKIAFLRITKNNKPRTIPLIDEVIEDLQKFYQNRNVHKPLVFASKTAFGKIDIKKSWNKALQTADIKNYVFHSNRHLFATLVAKQGASTLELQTATGHSSLSMLQRYTHLQANITRKYTENISNQILGGKNV
ncbi:MAG: Tyrosine recombinase XerD [Candidatus Anoxychlamydiales bacterium]|nr:Tyrosine recombinase XerD [Candidatus Anoxychlamydiales bacterium]